MATNPTASMTYLLGPRPLALHIATMTAFSMSCIAGLPLLKSGSAFWNPTLRRRAETLAAEAARLPEVDFARAVERECRRRHHAFAEGVARYRTFDRPYREPAYTVTCELGTTRLRDYGATGDAETSAPVVLIVPSLVNRCTVLDLTPERSFVRELRKAGFRPLLVDWDAPGDEEIRFDLTDYIVERLEPLLDKATEINGGAPVALAGYCMGGDLALALAVRRRNDIRGLALLATPWDFHGGDMAQVEMLKASLPILEQSIDTLGEMPVDLLQAMFAGLDPWMTAEKFVRFARLSTESPEAALFVALEDWLNDGVPLAPKVAMECLRGWYADNLTGRGEWRVAGDPVRPANIQVPTIAFIPGRDHIVPPPSARALADAIPGCETHVVAAGHIGMVTGSRAEEVLIRPLTAWLNQI